MKASSPASSGCMVLFGLPFLTAGLVLLAVGVNAIHESRAAASWPQVSATIEAVELRTSRTSKGGTTYTLECRYRYVVDGREYQGTRVGPDISSGGYREHEPELTAHRDSGQPFPARVNPADPADAVLFTDVSATGAFVLPAVGFVFAAAGAAICLGAVTSLRSARRRARREQEHPDRPWRHEPTWDDFRVPAEGGVAALVVTWLAGLFIALFVSIFVVLLAQDEEAPLFAQAIVGCFTLIPIGVLLTAAYLTARHLKYGSPVLHLKESPIVPTATLEGVVEVGSAIDAREAVKLTLKCTRTTTTGSGKQRSTTVDTLHEQSVVVPELEVRSAVGGGTVIPVRLVVPDGLPERAPGNPSHAWKLEVHCETPGVDFAATFDLPVFRADPALVERRSDPLPS